MGNHDRRDPTLATPAPQRSQREPVGDLHGVGIKRAQQFPHPSRHHRAVAASKRNQLGGHADSYDTGVQAALPGVRPRHDEKHLVPAGAVFGAQPIDRRSQATRTWSVEVGDLNHTHTREKNRPLCAINDAEPTAI